MHTSCTNAMADSVGLTGYSATVAVEFDVCGVFGLPCDFTLGAGLVTTYADTEQRDNIAGRLFDCLKNVQSSSGHPPFISFAMIAVNIANGCLETIGKFIEATSGVLLYASAGVGMKSRLSLLDADVANSTHVSLVARKHGLKESTVHHIHLLEKHRRERLSVNRARKQKDYVFAEDPYLGAKAVAKARAKAKARARSMAVARARASNTSLWNGMQVGAQR